MSRRQIVTVLVPIAGAGVLGVLAAVLFLLGESSAAAAITALLVTLGVVIAVDLHHRTRDLAHMVRLLAERQRATGEQMTMLIGPEGADPDSASARNTLLGRLEATEGRLLDALAADQLRTAELHRRLREELSTGATGPGLSRDQA